MGLLQKFQILRWMEDNDPSGLSKCGSYVVIHERNGFITVTRYHYLYFHRNDRKWPLLSHTTCPILWSRCWKKWKFNFKEDDSRLRINTYGSRMEKPVTGSGGSAVNYGAETNVDTTKWRSLGHQWALNQGLVKRYVTWAEVQRPKGKYSGHTKRVLHHVRWPLSTTQSGSQLHVLNIQDGSSSPLYTIYVSTKSPRNSKRSVWRTFCAWALQSPSTPKDP